MTDTSNHEIASCFGCSELIDDDQLCTDRTCTHPQLHHFHCHDLVGRFITSTEHVFRKRNKLMHNLAGVKDGR